MCAQEIYRICVQGRLTEAWSDWLQGLHVNGADPSCTVLTGTVRDQAALRGIINKLWDLNLILISVQRTEAEEDAPGIAGKD